MMTSVDGGSIPEHHALLEPPAPTVAAPQLASNVDAAGLSVDADDAADEAACAAAGGDWRYQYAWTGYCDMGEAEAGPVEEVGPEPDSDVCRLTLTGPDGSSAEVELPSEVYRTTDYYDAQDITRDSSNADAPHASDIRAAGCGSLAADAQALLDSSEPGEMSPQDAVGGVMARRKWNEEIKDRSEGSWLGDTLKWMGRAALNILPGGGLIEAAIDGRDVSVWDVVDLVPGVGKLGKLGKHGGKAADLISGGGKALNKMDDVADVAKTGQKASKTSPATRLESKAERKAKKNQYKDEYGRKYQGDTGRPLNAREKALRDRYQAKLDAKSPPGQPGGRTGKTTRLRELADDQKVSKRDRGWIKQEINAVKRSKNGDKPRTHIRNPPGKDLAHPPGKEAKRGHSYKEAVLQDRDLHKRQHKYQGK